MSCKMMSLLIDGSFFGSVIKHGALPPKMLNYICLGKCGCGC